MSSMSLALLIFGLCYLLIMTERLHKTIVALFGATVMISLDVVSQEEAFSSQEFGGGYRLKGRLPDYLLAVLSVWVSGHGELVFLQ